MCGEQAQGDLCNSGTLFVYIISQLLQNVIKFQYVVVLIEKCQVSRSVLCVWVVCVFLRSQ